MQSRTKVLFVRVTPAEHRALLAEYRKLIRGKANGTLVGVGDWVRHVALHRAARSTSGPVKRKKRKAKRGKR